MPSDTLKLSVGHPDSRKGIAYVKNSEFLLSRRADIEEILTIYYNINHHYIINKK